MISSLMTSDRSPLWFRPMLAALAVVALVAAPSLMAQSPTTRMQSEELRVTYLRPGVDLRSYDQFLLQPLDLQNTRIIPPPWVEDSDPRKWNLGQRNRRFLTEAFKQSMARGLEESDEFTVVEEPTEGALELKVTLRSLSPYAHSGDEVTTKGFGELAFEASLRDARTGELLALFEGTQQVGEDYQENTRFNRGHNFAQHFYTWGRNVSQRMSAIHKAK